MAILCILTISMKINCCKFFVIFSTAVVCPVKCCSAASKLKGSSFNIFAVFVMWVEETIRMASTNKRNSAGTKFLVLKFFSSFS